MTDLAPRIAEASFRFDHMPTEGRTLHVAATAEERAEIAAFLEVSELPRLEIELTALPFRDGIRVTGRLTADVVQPCVVTFAPVPQHIEEALDRVFLPGGGGAHAGSAGAEVFVDLEADDSPDYVEGPEIDLSDLVVESLALAIDPYPRAPGASLDYVLPPEDKSAFSPFADLKSLKDHNDT